MTKHDLKNAFLNLPLREDQADMCGCALGDGRYGRMRYAGFGGASFPRLNMAVAVELTRLLELRGATGARLVYVDDWFLASPARREAERNDVIFKQLMAELGFRLNPAKSCEPTQCLEFTGFVIDTLRRRLSVAPAKCAKLKARERMRQIFGPVAAHGEAVGRLLAGPGGRASAEGAPAVRGKAFEHMVGYLVHLSKAVPCGYVDLRPLWDHLGDLHRKYGGGREGGEIPTHATFHLSSAAVGALRSWWRVLDPGAPPLSAAVTRGAGARALGCWMPITVAAAPGA